MDNTYSPKEFGKLIGRTTNILQKWDRQGMLKAHCSPTHRRYSTHDQYVQYRGLVAQEQGLTIVYSRVSGVAQKPDLVNQINALEAYCQRHHTEMVVITGEHLSPEHEVVRDLIAMVSVFSARLPGLRSYRNVLKEAALQKE